MPAVQDWDWERLVEQLREGECIPFIGAGACAGSLPTGSALAARYADEYEYPFADRHDLARVTEYAAYKVGDAVDLKRRVARDLAAYRSPDFDDLDTPHGLLARYPIPLFLTTNYDTFMTEALDRRSKAATTTVCTWHRESAGRAADPRPDTPVVFHLHGAITEPASMVLTQHDYARFLLALAVDQGFDKKALVPTKIRPFLTHRPLLFIGYSLRDWSFQVLWRGLTQLFGREEQRRHISIQLVDGLHDDSPDTHRRAQSFLEHQHEKQQISVFWGSTSEFCRELNRRLGNPHGR
ncbi:SIR2 family protein [Cryptosporangium japonicum]|uniref:SIR2 family NAD-dependent protein deacylase n=1 Tax=Cryptosporangium japonicum TaxID=80872 RepID=UPI0031DFD428